MGRIPSGITWFDDDDFLGAEVVFEKPSYSSWRLDQKVIENENYEIEEDVTAGCAYSEATAVYFCSSTGEKNKGFPSSAVIKIRMQ
jgi:hypothetical protein